MEKISLLLPIVLLFIVAGCVSPSIPPGSTIQNPVTTSQQEQLPPLLNRYDAVRIPYSVKNYYSPYEAGFERVYKITLTDVEPLIRRFTFVPDGESIAVYRSQGRLIKPDNQDNYYLKIRIKSIEKFPRFFYQYSTGYQDFFKKYTDFVHLEIIQDDVDIFEHRFAKSKDVFWGRIYDDNDPNSLIVHQIVFFPASSSLSPGSGDKFSIRMIFTTSEHGQNADRAEDKLSLVGIDDNLSGYEGLPCIHFLRMVNKTDDSELGKSFTEDTWYAPAIGLVRLEQKVEGKTSMTWDLDNVVR